MGAENKSRSFFSFFNVLCLSDKIRYQKNTASFQLDQYTKTKRRAIGSPTGVFA